MVDLSKRENLLIKQAIKTKIEELEAYIDVLDKDILFENDSDIVFDLLSQRLDTHDNICEYEEILNKLNRED